MDETIVARVRALPYLSRVAVIALMIAATAVLGIFSTAMTPSGSVIAVWWPAAGVGVSAVLFARRRALTVAGTIAVVNVVILMLFGHRPLALAVIGGIAGGAEAYVVARVLTARGRKPHVSSMADVIRMLIASIIGATVVGMLGTMGIALIGRGNLLASFYTIVPSHFSATLLIVPLVLVSFRIERLAFVELAIQVAAFAFVLSAVGWPGQSLPLEFVPLPILLWAAIRFPLRVVVIELVLTGCVGLFLTLGADVPFAYTVGHTRLLTTTLLQGYLLTLCISVLLLGALRNEREALLKRVAATEASLRAGLGLAQVGLILLEPDGEVLRVLEMNSAAIRMLQLEHVADVTDLERVAQGRLRAHIQSSIERMSVEGATLWTGDWVAEENRHLQLSIAAIPALVGPNAYTIQLVDTTSRHQTEQTLATTLANEQVMAEGARELGLRQDEFVASVTDDLRTPIINMLGLAEELAATRLNVTQRTSLRAISLHASSLLAIVNNLLKLAELVHDPIPLRADPVPVALLIDECVEDLSAAASAKSVNLMSTIVGLDAATTSYPFEITQMLTSLTANAIRFTPAGGTVAVSAQSNDGQLSLTVSDTGMGIPREELPHVMERLTRSSRPGSPAAMGLGLAAVKGIADSLGATFAVESDGLTGTVARIILPPDEQPRPLPTSRRTVVEA
jgi:two-component system, OmpR family, phosphate regulon sensor histidine kinase PhoR